MREKARYIFDLFMTIGGACFATFLIAPPVLFLALCVKPGLLAHKLTRAFAWLTSSFMRLKFSVQGVEKIKPGTSYIITPNHQSNSDILALLSVLPCPFWWVVKRELLRIPFFGWGLAATGVISLDRKDRGQAVKSLRQGHEKLKDGWSVIIYPEGTRTSDGQLQPFKKGAFMMAVQTGTPILPVTCNGAFKVMPKNTLRAKPGHIQVIIGDPIPTEELTEADVPELMKKTWEAIHKNLDPDYDPFAHDKLRAQQKSDQR